MTFTPAERTRLVGILARLGSDFDGERAAAGLLASRMLKAKGLTWADVIDAPSEAGFTTSSHCSATNSNGPRSDLDLCRRHVSFLRAWEQDFIIGLSSTPRRSAKQIAILTDIAAGLRRRGKT